jgi:thiamine pyrophosphate-dependent acetolactate synthase large subunit-like protein
MEAAVEANPINPMRLFSELSSRLPDNAIVTADSGSSASRYARQLKFRGAMRGSLPGTLATMGPGVPYGIVHRVPNPPPTTASDCAQRRHGLPPDGMGMITAGGRPMCQNEP